MGKLEKICEELPL